ncbi:MAG: Galactokinase [Acidimicrobiales bacterium]|nr:Galactokinase [Acidimicrobiales bacterium]
MHTTYAPGRVNLIGDHTDYAGGLVLPMAIDLGTTVSGTRGGQRIELLSGAMTEAATIDLPVADPAAVSPRWARYVAGVAAELGTRHGFTGTVTSSIPLGAGLSSSAALVVSVALALGFDGKPLDLALLCQRAEQRASGLPCGVMDQLASAAGVEGHALLIDCGALTVEPVPIPEQVEIVVIHSGASRALAQSAYAQRCSECASAAALIGPLPEASTDDLARVSDPVLRQRARHVITECARVRSFVAALEAGELATAGRVMVESHKSLRDDFEVSTPALDHLVEDLIHTEGVYGARLTGGGFGGCVVALAHRGSAVEGRRVRPSAGARILPDGPTADSG